MSETEWQRRQRHRLAQAERDAVDLHAALAEAIRRLKLANERRPIKAEPIEYADLLAVLDRIAARTQPASVPRTQRTSP